MERDHLRERSLDLGHRGTSRHATRQVGHIARKPLPRLLDHDRVPHCILRRVALPRRDHDTAKRGGVIPAPLDFPYAITYITLMRTLSSTDLRANLSSVMDQVNDDHEPVIVTRAKGKPVVMVSLEDWASMDETTYLTASPANKAALDKAIAEWKAGVPGVVKTMAELLAYEDE